MNEPVSIAGDLVLDAHAEIGECPVWDDETATLVWVDQPRGVVHRFDPVTGIDEQLVVGQPVGAVALRKSGGLVLALRDGFGLVDADGGEMRLVCETELERTDTRMNDGKCDSAGRFWAGTMALDYTPGAGTLYRLDPDLTATAIVHDVTCSNGLAWSPDDRTMYFVDSFASGVDAFDFDPADGSVENRRRLVEIDPSEGQPDGMTIDRDGFLWVALWGGSCVRRYAPDDTLDACVRVPVAQVTSCAFGGPGLDDLYITSAGDGLTSDGWSVQPQAGGLFRASPGVGGAATRRFAG